MTPEEAAAHMAIRNTISTYATAGDSQRLAEFAATFCHRPEKKHWTTKLHPEVLPLCRNTLEDNKSRDLPQPKAAQSAMHSLVCVVFLFPEHTKKVNLQKSFFLCLRSRV